MRYFLAALIILGSNLGFAGEVEDAAAEAFAKEAAKGYAQSLATNYVNKLAAELLTEASEEAVNKALGENASTSLVSKGFAVYGFYKGVDQYLDAETQSQKYYASVQAAAAVVSYFNPIIGTAVSLFGIGQQALGDLAMKGRTKRLMQTYQEIMDMQKKTMDNIKLGITADTTVVIGINQAYVKLLTRMMSYQIYISENCSNFEGVVDQKIFLCAEMSIRSFHTMKQVANLLESILSFQSYFVSFDAFLKFSESEKTAEQYRQDLIELQKNLALQEAELQNMLRAMSDSTAQAYIEFTLKNQSQDLGALCHNHLMAATNRFSKIDFQILAAKKDAEKISYLLTTREASMTEVDGMLSQCTPEALKDSKSAPQVAQISNLLQNAKNKSYDNYLRELFQ